MPRFLALLALLPVLGLAPVHAGLPEIDTTDIEPEPTSPATTERWLLLPIDEDYPEKRNPFALFTPQLVNFRDLLDEIAAAREDDDTRGVLLRIDNPGLGWSQIQTLRAAIEDLRLADKQVIAQIVIATPGDYLIASACDEIVMVPEGMLLVNGLQIEGIFLRGLFDKLGIVPDIMQIGPYKGAGDMFTQRAFTDPMREAMTALLDDLWDQMLTMIADGREMEPSEVAAILDSGPFTADAALEAGLIDSLASPDALLALIEITAGEGFELTDAWDGDEEPAKPMGFMEIFQLFQPPARPAESPNPKIALIYASGPIIVSRADEGPFADPNVITSEEMIELLHECRDDDTVRAVVMRIDSPGGSAVASDMIWQEIVRLREIKPVVVSMGNIAASGGYYISMGATEIFAEPGTITGSIGVVTGKLALGGLLEGHLGITHDTISRGQNAGMFSSWSPFTDSEREAMRTLMEDIYDAFTTKAAESRGMDIDALRAVAEGRVWTGHQAQERGLVDTLGGLRTALDRAEALADFTGYDVRDVEILELPEPMNIMEWFAEYMAGEVAVTPPPPLAGALVASVLDLLSPTERALIGQVQLYQSLFNTEHTLTLMPVAFRVR